MTPNAMTSTDSGRLFNATVHFALQASEVQESIASAALLDLTDMQRLLIARSTETAYNVRLNNQNLARTYESLLNTLMVSLHNVLRRYALRAGKALPRFLNRSVPRQRSKLFREQIQEADIDPFDLEDVDGEDEVTFIGLTEEEINNLILALLWNQFSLRQQHAQFVAMQRVKLLNRLNTAVTPYLVNVQDDTQQTSLASRDEIARVLAREIQQSVAGGRGVQRSKSSGRDSLDTLIKTQSQQITNALISATSRKNAAIIGGERWSAVLDDRTCPRCQALDGRVFPFDANGNSTLPPLPLHLRCRCVAVPVFIRRTGIEQRLASPDVMTFPEWFSMQPVDVQKRILGVAKYRLWKDGGLEFRDFVEFRRQVPVRQRTLPELRA